MTNNYFRIGHRCVFFDENDYQSCERAWWAVSQTAGRQLGEIVLYRPIPMPGSWDVCKFVGLTRGEFPGAIMARRAGRSAA